MLQALLIPRAATDTLRSHLGDKRECVPCMGVTAATSTLAAVRVLVWCCGCDTRCSAEDDLLCGIPAGQQLYSSNVAIPWCDSIDSVPRDTAAVALKTCTKYKRGVF